MGRSKSRRAWLMAAAVAALTLLFAASPFGTRAGLAAIESYQAHVSPHLGGVVQCRFKPTCSHYGHEAIAKYGLLKGGAKTAWRIARCGPWTKLGTVDLP
ncbi:MAG TPA: membrane protein insertion efficiency factor YidD [Thermoanaerobaculia bacterium]